MKIDKAAGRKEGVSQEVEALREALSFHLQGDFLTISERSPLSIRFPEREEAEAELFSTLRLVYGIGEHYDRSLRESGYGSIPSLASHPRFGERARERLGEWGEPIDPAAVYRALSDWLPSSHDLFLRSLGLIEPDGILFFDVETLGLANAPIFLAATGRIEHDGLKVEQHLAASIEGEVPLIEGIGRELAKTSVLISYNGKSFDWPILRERSSYYGIPIPDEPIHIDLLHHSRRRYRKILPDLQLRTVEERILGVDRGEDLPSYLVPGYYATYLKTGDPDMLVPILVHNRQDIVSLALLLSTLLDEGSDAR